MRLKSTKNEQFVTSDEILKMKYTMKVVDETIRVANVAAFLYRTTTKDVTYKGIYACHVLLASLFVYLVLVRSNIVCVLGYTIPKGWNVILWIRYLHTDPENFNDPLNFNPDRWDVSSFLRLYI